ncbi:GIY-YIG nuclease family protein [Candidatus Saganbacteria bacterium]|nr:GIY-YIG nuclease family protein [Candidatus Saganbacteria bacterium]
MFFIYVLKSSKDNNLYIGFTNNLDRRIKQHNSGRVKSTKHRVPFVLIYKETVQTKEEAVEREKHLKSGSGRDFIKKMKPQSVVDDLEL